MLQLIDKLGVKRTLYAVYVVALAVAIGAAALFVRRSVRADLEDALQRRVES